jgi:hypothetical protein
MKTPDRKIRGGSNSPLTQLKMLCSDKPQVLEKILKHMNTPRADKLYPKSAEMRQFIGEHFEIQLQRDSQFSSFLQWVRLEETKDERELKISDAINKYRQENPDATDEELLLIGQRMFREISIAEEDPKMWVAVLREEIRKKKLGLQEREVKLAEEKFQFDASKAALKIWPSIKQISSDKTLSEADKVQAVRQKLFGVIPA